MEEYIENNFASFDPVIFFEHTASELSCERAKYLFEKAVDKIASSTTKPFNLVSWCITVKNFSYEIINTDEALIYWTNRNTKTARLLDNLANSRNNCTVSESIASSSAQVQGKMNLVSRMKRKDEPKRKTESDELSFNGISVATKLKNNAEDHVKIYYQLNNKAKHVTGISLNSTVDISDHSIDSQKQYFTDEEWQSIKTKFHFKNKKYASHTKYHCLKKLNNTLKNLDLSKAYILARKLEIEHIETPDEAMYKIYAHIIDIYRFHSEALRFKSNEPTELDNLMKIWSGIFEALFPDSNRIRCKWGESVAEHNKFKIDCRLIFFYNDKLIDLVNMEAARYMTAKKTNDDHLKLTIESKDILDYIIKNSNNFNHKSVSIPMIQLCNNSCDVSKIYLVDNGLYCVDQYLNLTVPLSPVQFAESASDWFHKLFTLRNHIFSLLHYLDGNDNQKTYDSHFSRPKGKAEGTDYDTWIRGSFYPPLNENDPIYVPENLYGPINSISNKKQK